MEITETQIFNYMYCPTKYDAMFNKNIVSKNKPSMNMLLNKVADYFFLNLMNGKIIRPDGLKKKWDKICEKNQDFITPTKNLDGMKLIMQMFNWAQDKQILIGDINIPYIASYKGKYGLIDLKGEISAISFNKEKVPEILILDFSGKTPDRMMLDMNLKYTMISFGYYMSYNKNIMVLVHYVKQDKDLYVFYSIDAYQRLKDTVDSIAACIKNKLYYPRETVLCSACDLKGFCKAWSVSQNL